MARKYTVKINVIKNNVVQYSLSKVMYSNPDLVDCASIAEDFTNKLDDPQNKHFLSLKNDEFFCIDSLLDTKGCLFQVS